MEQLPLFDVLYVLMNGSVPGKNVLHDQHYAHSAREAAKMCRKENGDIYVISAKYRDNEDLNPGFEL